MVHSPNLNGPLPITSAPRAGLSFCEAGKMTNGYTGLFRMSTNTELVLLSLTMNVSASGAVALATSLKITALGLILR